jgi:hypothetical protein
MALTELGPEPIFSAIVRSMRSSFRIPDCSEILKVLIIMLVTHGFKKLEGYPGTTQMIIDVSDKGLGHMDTSRPQHRSVRGTNVFIY